MHPRASSSLEPAYAAALGGDMPQALRRLRALDAADLDENDAEIRAILLRRFGEGLAADDEVPEGLAGRAVAIYRDYWRRALVHELSRGQSARFLREKLEGLFTAQPRPRSLEAMTAELGTMLRHEGLHSLHGVTAPFHELMLWKHQTTCKHTVKLPACEVTLTVNYLHDFVELGWAAFATAGQRYTGGWATDEALYCVAHRYDLDSERFCVSYLVHEAQHFADYSRFPSLDQPELEYRAKLAELATASETCRELLSTFIGQRGLDRGVPHQHANQRVVESLETLLGSHGEWSGASCHDINAAASALLRRDSERLAQATSDAPAARRVGAARRRPRGT